MSSRLLRESFPAEISNWDVNNFNLQARALFFTPQTDPYGDKYAVLLNRTALAFLYPPHEIFLSAVATDFKKSQEVTIPDLVGFLFATTNFYFSHREAMPQCASLVSFRDKNRESGYRRFQEALLFPPSEERELPWFFALLGGSSRGVVSNRENAQARHCRSRFVCQRTDVIGLFMMLANCVLTIFQPRYTLPMWELTIVSLSFCLDE